MAEQGKEQRDNDRAEGQQQNSGMTTEQRDDDKAGRR